MATSTTTLHFLNVEYFFRLLYELLMSPHTLTLSSGGLLVFASQVWLVVTALSLIVCVGLLWIFVSATIRYHQTEREDEERHATLHADHAEEERDHSRWEHIRELAGSAHENDWRQAIIEADIMLDDLLTQLGYAGQSVGEKLRAADPSRFHTLQNAWDAHKVRNEIAHAGSAYPLEERMAHRTIALYETVMREHGEI